MFVAFFSYLSSDSSSDSGSDSGFASNVCSDIYDDNDIYYDNDSLIDPDDDPSPLRMLIGVIGDEAPQVSPISTLGTNHLMDSSPDDNFVI